MSIASSGQQATDSLNGKLTFEQDKNRIVGRDENNLIRMLILANGSDFVMKVSKEGFDALTASNEDLIFNSSQNIFKIVDSDTVTAPVATATMTASTMAYGSATTTIPHGLSYAPNVIGVVTEVVGTPQGRPMPFIITSGSNTIQIIQTYQVGADDTNIYVYSSIQVWRSAVDTRSDSTPSGTIIKYYILQESYED